MTLVVGHRGAAGHAPENTFPSYELAVEMGVDAIELDVHLTSDGKLAVIHDDTLERTTDGTGPIRDQTLKQIQQADAGATFTAADGSRPFAGKGLRVPLLREVLGWLPAGVGLVVEIKALEAVGPTVKALRRSAVQRAGGLTVISFDERAIDEVHAIAPEIPTGLLLVPSDSIERGLTYATEHGHIGVHPWEGDLGMDPAPILSQAMAYGRQVGCYVLNDPERMQHLAAYRLWGFVTDVPDVARAALGPRAS
jgi:glycerophosphoryl diester phosphodiesterase